MNNGWFGKSWGAPVCEPATHAPTPVGEPCLWCDEPIVADDDGVLIVHLADNGPSLRPQHIECFERSITGGVNHLMKQCECCGGTLPPDPPNLTRRQAAAAASRLYALRRFWEKPEIT